MKPAQPKHFLLVDDHAVVTTGLKTLLKPDFLQANFYTATNGKEALKILSQQSVDILMLDVSMPEMDGYTVFPLIKKNYQDTHVIILTQYSGEPLIRHFIQLKASAILLKGDTTELTAAIQTVWNDGFYLSEAVRKNLENKYHDLGIHLPLSTRANELIRHIARGTPVKKLHR